MNRPDIPNDLLQQAAHGRGRCTITADGAIPHRWHPVLKIECPIAIEIGLNGRRWKKVEVDSQGRPVPERDANGNYLYVLPGGSRWRPLVPTNGGARA